MKGIEQNLLFVLNYRVEDETEENTSKVLNLSTLTKQIINQRKKKNK